jgi:predicted metalloprotease with PDZ domain
VRDASGTALPLEIRGNGHYTCDTRDRPAPIVISYEVRLARALEPGQYALTSSLGPEAAFLLAADIFPDLTLAAVGTQGSRLSGTLRVEISPPEGWQVATSEKGEGGVFDVSDPKRAVFFLGRLRGRTLEIGRMRLRIGVTGAWDFSDDQVASLGELLARTQATMVGGAEEGNFLVTLAPFPLPLTGLRSAALARGSTVILMLNPGNDRARTLQHLQRHLAHEMFHFYMPNAFRIRENFDWFWEGFTRYVALVTLAETRTITLDDFLAALGDEYDAYTANPLRGNTSLVSASPEKFSSAASYEIVYRKGMVVAALYDLELRWQSRGKRRLSEIIRTLYQNYARPGREVGNREVLDELKGAGNFSAFLSDYVEGVREIELVGMLAPYGIIIDSGNAQRRPRLAAAPKLSDRQRELIEGLKSPAQPRDRAN